MIGQGFLLIVTISGGVLAGTAVQSNWYMDQVLNHLRAIALHANVDAARIQDIDSKAEHRLPTVASNTRYYYLDGKMTGLLRVQRAGDCAAPIREYGNTTISCMLFFNDIKFEYNTDLRYGSLSYAKGTVTATMGPTYAAVEITSNSIRNSPFVKKLHITHTGTVIPSFPRVGLFDYYPADYEQKEFATLLTAEFYSVFNFNLDPSLRSAASRVILPAA